MLKRAGIEAEPDFYDESSRKLEFATNQAHISFIRVRSFDVATFVAFGAAQLGVAGAAMCCLNSTILNVRAA